MRRSRAGIILASVVFSWTASAADTPGAVSVIGNEAARSCFVYARYGGPTRDGAATCSDALEAGSLSRNNRAATFVNRAAYYDRGLTKEKLHDYKGACADYREALSYAPGFAPAQRLVGVCRAREVAKSD